MNRALYYCDHWQHKKIEFGQVEYDICISPLISGNTQGTLVQFHGIVISGREAVRMGMLKKNVSNELASLMLEDFERRLSITIRSFVTWQSDNLEKGVVKIWYYQEDDKDFETDATDKRKYPPLRFTVTVANINFLSDDEGALLRDELEKAVVNWLCAVSDCTSSLQQCETTEDGGKNAKPLS